MAKKLSEKKRSWRAEEFADDPTPATATPRLTEPSTGEVDLRDPWSIAAICHRRGWPMPIQQASGSGFSLAQIESVEREVQRSHGLAVDKARTLDLCQYLRAWAGHPRADYDA